MPRWKSRWVRVLYFVEESGPVLLVEERNWMMMKRGLHIQGVQPTSEPPAADPLVSSPRG